MREPRSVMVMMERPGSEVLERTTHLSLSDVFAELGSGPEGLSSGEAEVRLRRIGPNAIPGSRGPSRARQLLEQMIHLFALMLWVAAILACVGGMPQLGWAIIAVVIINGVFSFVAAVGVEAVILLCFVHITPVARLLGMHALTPSRWIPVLVAPFVLLVAEESRQAIIRRRARA